MDTVIELTDEATAQVEIQDNAYSFREERTRDAAYVGLLEGIHKSLETIAAELTKINESSSTTKSKK